jgi:hypothetical protein
MSNKLVLAIAASSALLSMQASAQSSMSAFPPVPSGPPSAPMPMGAAAVSPAQPNPLKYRDPSKPLTIGEMSEMARTKQLSEFLGRHGYTAAEPPKPVKPQPGLKERPSVTLRALAVWGSGKSQAEIAVAGRVVVVTGGETLAPGVRVQSVTPGQILLSVSRNEKRKTVTEDVRLGVGKEVEIRL